MMHSHFHDSKNIILDYHKDPEIFNTTAQKWAKSIEKTKKTQVRNFYDYVLDLVERSEKEDFKDVLPFVKMLNSKVAYAHERKHASDEFRQMINLCVNQITTKEQLRVFQLFFEAVLGFYQGK